MVVLMGAWIMGCGVAEERYSPEALKESVTHKNPHIKYAPGVLVLGASREDVFAVFGPPNGSEAKNGVIEDVYIFLDDGSKYVNPTPRARNVALAVVTMGVSVAVRQARLAYQRTDLSIYHVYYSPEEKITRVTKEAGSAFKNPSKTD